MVARSRLKWPRVLGVFSGALLLLAGTPALAAQPGAAQTTGAPGAEVCKACHAPYYETYKTHKHSTKADPRTPANRGECATCHGDGTAHVKAGGGRGVGGIINPRSKSLAAEAKNSICLTCHQGGKRMLWAGSTHATRDTACVSCHQVHQPDKVRDKATQTEVCFTCHKEQRAQINRPSRHPVKEGKVVCSDCHNPHGSAGPKLMARDSVVETCYTCHMEKRGPFIWNHQPVTEDCTLCHNPHGTIAAYLLKQRPPFLCQQCHEPTSHRGTVPSATPVTGPPFSSGLAQWVVLARGCMNCHNNIHGSNNPTNTSGSRSLRR